MTSAVRQHTDAERAAAHARTAEVRAVRESIFAEIIAERQRQIDLGYDDAHDRRLAPETFLLLTSFQLIDLVGQGGEVDRERWQRQMIRAAAVIFASLEVTGVAAPVPPRIDEIHNGTKGGSEGKGKVVSHVPSSGP